MDIVHHALIGGAGMLVAGDAGHEMAGVAFLAASVFPDLDVFFMLAGKRAYLRNHQGLTHSLPLAPLYALGLAWGACALLGQPWQWSAFAGALAGLALHVLLDWCNTFRIALLAPLDRRRYSLDAVFFIDGVALSLTALFYLLYLYYGQAWAAWAYPAAFAAYALGKIALQRRVMRTRRPLFAIPSALHPCEFYLLEQDGAGLRGCLYNAWSGRERRTQSFPAFPEEAWRLARRCQVFQDMQAITRALRITSVERGADGTVIHARDLAVRNFGGKFAATRLEFDPQGELRHALANI